MAKFLSLICFILFYSFGNGQNLTLTKIDIPSLSQPVEITNTGIPNDNRLFVVERAGTIRIVDSILTGTPSLLATPYVTIGGVNTSSEGGLLGLAFDPQFSSNGHFFVYYTTSQPGAFTSRISRFTASSATANIANGGSEVVVLEVTQFSTNHNGGDLAFGPDGLLYIPFGDGGSFNDPEENGQDSTSILGSMLRIDVSSLPYSIPVGNPYIGNPLVPDEIWSIGWRNPFRFSFDRVTGHMWIADVGQWALEEIDVEPFGTPGGLNYGWDCYEASSLYENVDCLPASQYTFPVYEYNHGLGNSVTGGYVYRGVDYPDLLGHYIFTDYTDSYRFWALSTDASGAVTGTSIQTFSGGQALSNVAAIGEDADGELYAAELVNGDIYKIGAASLPITLSEFSVRKSGNTNILEWTTLSEVNGSHFDIERSGDGTSFYTVGRQESAINSNAVLDYSFTDEKPLIGLSYYRLKLVDLDGSFEYSKIVEMSQDQEAVNFTIRPNPTSDKIYISSNGQEDIGITLFSNQGKRVLQQQLLLSNEAFSLSLGHLPPGIYMLQIQTDRGKQIHQIIRE